MPDRLREQLDDLVDSNCPLACVKLNRIINTNNLYNVRLSKSYGTIDCQHQSVAQSTRVQTLSKEGLSH